MTRLRRAWAVLLGREDPMHRALVDDCNGLVRKLVEANNLNAGLHAKVDRLKEELRIQDEANDILDRDIQRLRNDKADLERINAPMAKDLGRFISENANLRADLDLCRQERDAANARVQSLERVLQTIIDNASDGIAEGLDP